MTAARNPVAGNEAAAGVRDGTAVRNGNGNGNGNGSVIHDIGYQRYTGPRLGRGYAVRSLYSQSLRGAFGLGRGAKAKIFPWSVFGLVMMVAAVATAVRAQTQTVAISYLQFPDTAQLLVLVFLAVVAPELVSRDLRAGVLPLYFSRPLRRADYALVKVAALASAAWLLLLAPQLLMFLGGAFGSTHGVRDVFDEFGSFAQGAGYAAVHAVLLSSIALLVAALTSRRAVAAGAIVATFMVTLPVMGVLTATGGQTQRELAGLANPFTLLQGVREWMFSSTDAVLGIGSFGPLYGAVTVALVLLSVTLLLERYRRVAQ